METFYAIVKWLRKKLARKEDGLPFLPAQRPRILTPSPSHEFLVPSVASAAAKSSFFQRLPFEIRHKILTEAFGDMTVHMDLRYDRPPVPSRGPKFSHAGVHAPGGRPKLDKSKPKQWRWWSSVCHRSAPIPLGESWSTKPFEDGCRWGEGYWCESWPGETQHKCFIGAMGWLLSCRQAYAEGIDILYSTNNIHMASNLMIICLPQLLLPQRLAGITSIEILWHLRPSTDSRHSDPPGTHLINFFRLLNVLPMTFPRLKELYLSLQSTMKSPKRQVIDTNEATIMSPVDEMVRRFHPRLKIFTFAVPRSLFKPIAKKAAGNEPRLINDNPRHMDRLWRELPRTDTEDRNRTSPLRGYWVALGQRD